MRGLDGITNSMDMNLSNDSEGKGTWHAAVNGIAKSGTRLSN